MPSLLALAARTKIFPIHLKSQSGRALKSQSGREKSCRAKSGFGAPRRGRAPPPGGAARAGPELKINFQFFKRLKSRARCPCYTQKCQPA